MCIYISVYVYDFVCVFVGICVCIPYTNIYVVLRKISVKILAYRYTLDMSAETSFYELYLFKHFANINTCKCGKNLVVFEDTHIASLTMSPNTLSSIYITEKVPKHIQIFHGQLNGSMQKIYSITVREP